MVPVAWHHTGLLTSPGRRRIAGVAALVMALLTPVADALGAQAIRSYVETVTLERDGSAHITIDLQLAGGGDRLPVPLDAVKPRLVSVSGGETTAVEIVTADGRSFADVRWRPNDAGTAALRLDLAVDQWPGMSGAPLAFGNRRLAFRFVNTSSARIASYRAVLVLPPGFLLTSVDAVDPPVTDATVTLPYGIGMQADRQTIAIRERALAGGDRTGLTFRTRPERSALPLLTVLAVVAAGFLVRFRDLVRPATTPVSSRPIRE